MLYETGNVIRGIIGIKLNLDIVRDFLGSLIRVVTNCHDDGVSLGGCIRFPFADAADDFPALSKYCQDDYSGDEHH